MFIVFFSSVLGTFSLRNHKLSFCLPFLPHFGHSSFGGVSVSNLLQWRYFFVGVNRVTLLKCFSTSFTKKITKRPNAWGFFEWLAIDFTISPTFLLNFLFLRELLICMFSHFCLPIKHISLIEFLWCAWHSFISLAAKWSQIRVRVVRQYQFGSYYYSYQTG